MIKNNYLSLRVNTLFGLRANKVSTFYLPKVNRNECYSEIRHEVHETVSDNAARSTVQRTIESEEHCLLGYLTPILRGSDVVLPGEPRDHIVINIDVKSCNVFSNAVTSSSVTVLQQSSSALTLCASSVTLVNEPVNDLLPCSTSYLSTIDSCSSMDATSFCDKDKFRLTKL